jgi:hypothetical protein
MMRTIWNDFLSQKDIKNYIKLFSHPVREIHSTELICHLSVIHMIALKCILTEYTLKGLGNYDWIKDMDGIPNWYTKILGKLPLVVSSESVSKIYEITLEAHNQMRLLFKYNNRTKNRMKNIILLDFPEMFIKKISNMVYPQTYISCFMEKCEKESLWSFYADNHKGVCLKFRTHARLENKKYISLDCGSFDFNKVTYQKEHPKIDFFQYLGTLPLDTLIRYWFTNDNGDVSPFKPFSNENIDGWRKQYWEKHNTYLTIKSPSWEDENEYRLILPDIFFNSRSEKDARKLKYQFDDLEGIIFGYRTSTDDKIRIMEIIDKKCVENCRSSFDFYQADFSITGDFEIKKFGLLKVSSSRSVVRT